MAQVAVLGMGAMGSRMAARLADAGHTVVVWNRTPGTAQDVAERIGATAAADPAAAVRGADVVIAVVTDDDASRALWLDAGALEAVPAGAIAVESSTLTPAWTRELADAAAAHGRTFVACPLLGSLPQIDGAQAMALLGGDAEACARLEPVVAAYCSRAERIGGPGDAAVFKLAVNALLAAQAVALAEVLDLTRRAGLDQDVVSELLPTLHVMSPQLGRVAARMQAASYAPNFPIDLLVKDLDYGLGAHPEPSALPLIEHVRDRYAAASAAGLGELDFVAIDATTSSRREG